CDAATTLHSPTQVTILPHAVSMRLDCLLTAVHAKVTAKRAPPHKSSAGNKSSSGRLNTPNKASGEPVPLVVPTHTLTNTPTARISTKPLIATRAETAERMT